MAPGTTFVHDFVGVDRPVEAVLAAVPRVVTDDSVRDLLLRAWSAEAEAMQPAEETNGNGTNGNGVSTLHVEVGPPRVRRDAMVMPVSWSGSEPSGLPPLESDLEFTSFGEDRTHVHLYGRSAISAMAPLGSREANHSSRVAVAVVRRFLGELAAALEATADGGTTPLIDADSRTSRPTVSS